MKPKLDRIVVEGIDPGTVNMGVAVVAIFTDVRAEVVDFDALLVRKFRSTVDKSTPLADAQEAFQREQASIVRHYDVDALAVERYLPRGGTFGGISAEKIGIMIGTTVEDARRRKIHRHMFLPAEWKNALNRLLKANESVAAQYVVKPRRKRPKNLIEKYVYALVANKFVHCVDSLLIALYHADRFAFVSTPRGYRKLVETIRGIDPKGPRL